MLAAALALGASIGWGSADFLGGVKSRRLGVMTTLGASQLIGLVLIAAVVAIDGPDVPNAEFAAYAMLSAVTQTVGMVAYYHGLASGAMGIVAPISSMAALVPVTAGLATGERPSAVQGAGVAFAVVGLVLASYQPGQGEGEGGERRVAVGVGMALIAALGFGTFYVLIDAATDRGGTLSAVLLNRVVAVALLGLACLFVARLSLTRVGLRDLGGLTVLAVLAVGASTLFAVATTKGLVSIVAVLGALYPVTTVVLAQVFLREQVRPVQRLGAASALAGAALISL